MFKFMYRKFSTSLPNLKPKSSFSDSGLKAFLIIYFPILITHPLLIMDVINGRFLEFFFALDFLSQILLSLSAIIFFIVLYIYPEIFLEIISRYFIRVFIILPVIFIYILIIFWIFELNLEDFYILIYWLKKCKLIVVICFCCYIVFLMKKEKNEDLFKIMFSIFISIFLFFIIYYVGYVTFFSIYDLLALITIQDYGIKSEQFTDGVLSKHDSTEKILKQKVELESDYSKKSSSRNIVSLLCKFEFLDVIINPYKYSYIPSYFQKSSITLPWLRKLTPSILDMIDLSKFRYSVVYSMIGYYPYDTPYSTMPILSSRLESLLVVREEILSLEIIPSLRLKLLGLSHSFEECRTLTVLIEHFGTYRSLHPWFGALYDVFTEYLGPSNRAYRLLVNSKNELSSLQGLMEHNSNLLQEAGLLNYSSEESELESELESESESE